MAETSVQWARRWVNSVTKRVTISDFPKSALIQYLAGGFKYFSFHLYLGKIPNVTNIFQRGCNHQLGNRLFVQKFPKSFLLPRFLRSFKSHTVVLLQILYLMHGTNICSTGWAPKLTAKGEKVWKTSQVFAHVHEISWAYPEMFKWNCAFWPCTPSRWCRCFSSNLCECNMATYNIPTGKNMWNWRISYIDG